MAAKGTVAKAQILEKIKEIYPNAFEVGKEFRIPLEENGEAVEIKIAMTCAKELLGTGDVAPVENTVKPEVVAAPTENQKKDVSEMLKSLGF